MRKFLVAVLFVMLAPLFAQAQNIQMNWDGQNHYREITDDSNDNKSLAIVGAGSLDTGAIDGASMTVNGKKININTDAVAKKVYDSVDRTSAEAITFGIPVSGQETTGAYVAGGAAYRNNVTNSSVSMTGTTLQGRDVMGGASFLLDGSARLGDFSANNNSVTISGGSLSFYNYTVPGSPTVHYGGNVYGGYTMFAKGTANNNTVIIKDGANVAGNVFGGVTTPRLTDEDQQKTNILDTRANGNYVLVQGSTVDGIVSGAMGAATANDNTVIIDNSNVGSAFGASIGRGITNGTESVVNMNNNTVIVRNGSTVATTAMAVMNKSVNAQGNTMTLDNSTMANGAAYSVLMYLGNDVSGGLVQSVVANNTLNLNNLTSTFKEVGGSLSFAGTSNGNTVNILNSNVTLTNAGKKFFDEQLDFTKLAAANLLPADVPADKGLIFGGASMDYTATINSTPSPEAPEEKTVAFNGTNSDGNLVNIAGGNSVKTVDANVFGGFSAYIREVDYRTVDETGVIETVKKNGLTTTTTSSDPAAEPTEPETAEKVDNIHSASNNTVVLDNVKFKGKVYGGYVYGAELKPDNMRTQNNTVILRNKVELDPNAVIYGGNNGMGRTTNQLVFDRTIGTFKDKNQFRNFNSWWTINADFNTKLNFTFDVHARMLLDKSTMKEGSAIVVTTKTEKSLTGIEEGGVVYELLDSGIVLTQKKVGVFSYSLTPTKEGTGNLVNWTLTSTKDKANAEVYGQLPLVGLALISEGPEMLTQT